MTHETSIPLVQKSYDLYKTMHEFSKPFPKSDKYTLGERTKSLILELLELFIQAESAKKEWKQPILEKASHKIGLLKLLVRLPHEMKILDQKKYLDLSERLQEIGRMTGGWIKALR